MGFEHGRAHSLLLLFLLVGAVHPLEGEGEAAGNPDNIESRWTTIDGVEVHYRESAGPWKENSPILLFVHGWMGSSYDFVDLMKVLPPGTRAIAPDLPGCGLSQKTGIDFSVEYYAGFLRSFVRSLDIKRVILAGHSMGGGIAVNFTAENQEMVERLVLIDPDGLRDEEGFLGFIRRIDPIVDLGTLLNNRTAIEVATRINVFHNPDFATKQFLDSVADTCLTREGRKAQATITKQVLGAAPVDEVLPTLRVPTLIIWGKEDRLLPAKWAFEYARKVAGARVAMIPEAGHMPQIESPMTVWQCIRGFTNPRDERP